jgi:hypothetical protein
MVVGGALSFFIFFFLSSFECCCSLFLSCCESNADEDEEDDDDEEEEEEEEEVVFLDVFLFLCLLGLLSLFKDSTKIQNPDKKKLNIKKKNPKAPPAEFTSSSA